MMKHDEDGAKAERPERTMRPISCTFRYLHAAVENRAKRRIGRLNATHKRPSHILEADIRCAFKILTGFGWQIMPH